jgi:hypothetical protein
MVVMVIFHHVADASGRNSNSEGGQQQLHLVHDDSLRKNTVTVTVTVTVHGSPTTIAAHLSSQPFPLAFFANLASPPDLHLATAMFFRFATSRFGQSPATFARVAERDVVTVRIDHEVDAGPMTAVMIAPIVIVSMIVVTIMSAPFLVGSGAFR